MHHGRTTSRVALGDANRPAVHPGSPIIKTLTLSRAFIRDRFADFRKVTRYQAC